MNRIILIVCTIVIGLTLFSCKNDGKTPSTTEPNVSNKAVTPQMTKLRENAKAVFDYRIKNGEFSTAQILDNGVWEYKFTFADGAMSELGALAGKWIDFADNNTYQYGNYDVIEGSGIYHYNPISTIILMIDNDAATKPQEFEMKLVMDALVMVGQKTYNDNSTQSKLDKREVRPTKG